MAVICNSTTLPYSTKESSCLCRSVIVLVYQSTNTITIACCCVRPDVELPLLIIHLQGNSCFCSSLVCHLAKQRLHITNECIEFITAGKIAVLNFKQSIILLLQSVFCSINLSLRITAVKYCFCCIKSSFCFSKFFVCQSRWLIVGVYITLGIGHFTVQFQSVVIE